MYEFTDEQVNCMRTSIENMLDQTRDHMSAIDSVCDSEYLKGRSKYPITALVYSGFSVEEQNIPGFTIQKIQYGKGRFMPELYNSDAVVQLYSDKADPYSVLEAINKYNAYGQRYQIIEVTVDDDTYQLDKLVQVTFDGITDKGRLKAQEKKVLFQREA
jgi:hypothetical protein